MVSPSTALHRPTLRSTMKYVIVSGGVCSSLGKGVTTSSIGALLKAKGFRVTAIKVDPYLNVDAGLMSPYEHGEVFVLDDGGEADLDLGNYERMLGCSLTRMNNITTGKVYSHVINKERKGSYLGRTVQVVPHITGEVIQWIDRVAHTPTDTSGLPPQVCVIELGGTVGDIESMPFFEAIRQFRNNSEHPNSICMVHCTFVPIMSGQKTKPTQHTVKALQQLGIQPDIIVCRCSEEIEPNTKVKIATQCNVKGERVISAHNIPNLFHFVEILEKQDVFRSISQILCLDEIKKETIETPSRTLVSLESWANYAKSVDQAQEAQEVRIAFIGKYIKGGEDAYLSVVKALEHSAVEMQRKLVIEFINSTDLQPEEEKHKKDNADQLFQKAIETMQKCDGIFVPGGFGDRGVEGKVRAAKLAREWKKPYLGVCLGMQVAIMEFGRHVLNLEGATSEEFDPERECPHHVLKYMPEIPKDTMGANMRLGARSVEILSGSMAHKLYGGATKILERHRHRYEFNTDYYNDYEEAGLIFTGKDETKQRMDIIELRDHPFFVGVQYHPEFKSRPNVPSPPFFGFVAACCNMDGISDFLDERLKDGPNPLFEVKL